MTPPSVLKQQVDRLRVALDSLEARSRGLSVAERDKAHHDLVELRQTLDMLGQPPEPEGDREDLVIITWLIGTQQFIAWRRPVGDDATTWTTAGLDIQITPRTWGGMLDRIRRQAAEASLSSFDVFETIERWVPESRVDKTWAEAVKETAEQV